MASENSFDIVSKVDFAEVKNAINQSEIEIRQRFDFKGSKSEMRLDEKENKITITSDDEIKLKSVVDILQSKCVKRKVPIKNFTYGNVTKAGGGLARQEITIQQGIPVNKSKEIINIIKETKIKVQPSIQQDQIRVTGKKKDDLQQIIALLNEKDLGINLQFINFR